MLGPSECVVANVVDAAVHGVMDQVDPVGHHLRHPVDANPTGLPVGSCTTTPTTRMGMVRVSTYGNAASVPADRCMEPPQPSLSRPGADSATDRAQG